MNNFPLLTSSKTSSVKQRDVRNSKDFNQAQINVINPRSFMGIMQQDKYKKYARKYEKTKQTKTRGTWARQVNLQPRVPNITLIPPKYDNNTLALPQKYNMLKQIRNQKP